jgi:lysophospholipase L1-like esterase
MPCVKKSSRRLFLQNISFAAAGSMASENLLAARPENPEGLNDRGQNAIILFQGDSITDGNRSRNNDWNHVMGHGYAYLVASRLTYQQPEKNFHFYNRGISGNKVTDLAVRWQEDTINLKPDVLSILIGVNDVNSMFTEQDPVNAKKFEEVYRSILLRAKEKLPAVQLVICEPFLFPFIKVKENWLPEPGQ